ncbi:MAG TPA: histidine kinase [Candidatus Binatia bacterium]|jgi:signal transduction histidine kinase
MSVEQSPQFESRIAGCRLVLSVVALAAVFLDPTAPFVASRIPIASGRFTIDPAVLTVMGTHLVYSILALLAARTGSIAPQRLATLTIWIDVLLGGAIALMTEGATSPFYPFFAYAVVVSGLRAGLRQALVVTAASVALYLCMIAISAPGNTNIYMMRPVYLAIVGYLVGYLGQQRLELEQELQIREAAEQRHRIARDLHDGFAQAMAGINLKVESCRRLLRASKTAEALGELTELQASVTREYDELRSFMRTLADLPPSPSSPASASRTRFSLRVSVDGSIDLADHVLQIAREGLSNVRRHSAAASARIRVATEESGVRIWIEDDGLGLRSPAPPWSIASRVREIGGSIDLGDAGVPGFHMQILLPRC